MENELKGWLQSSQDPTQIANKVKGVILLASSFIIFFVGHFFHITLTAEDVLSLGSELGAIAGLLWAVYGGILHFVTWWGTVTRG
jgi:hypothetical protein